jgi:hypothetical protein
MSKLLRRFVSGLTAMACLWLFLFRLYGFGMKDHINNSSILNESGAIEPLQSEFIALQLPSNDCPPNKDRESFAALLAHWHTLATFYKIPYVIGCGSLLGQYRDGDIITWDEDVDVLVDIKKFKALEVFAGRRNFEQTYDEKFHFVVQKDFERREEDDRTRLSCTGQVGGLRSGGHHFCCYSVGFCLCWCYVLRNSGEYDVRDVTLSVYPHRASLKNMPDRRRFDSHRGQAYFSSLPGVDIHSEYHHKHCSVGVNLFFSNFQVVRDQIDSCSFVSPMGRVIQGFNHLDIFPYVVSREKRKVLDLDMDVDYNLRDFFPFKECVFMNVKTSCPRNIRGVLEAAYDDLKPDHSCVHGAWMKNGS